MRGFRFRSGVVVTICGLALLGCSEAPEEFMGEGTGTPAVTPSASCTDRVSSDPWIAFTPALKDQNTMTAGDRGWTTIVTDPKDATVTGDTGAVELSAQRAPTLIECGTVKSSISWLEVKAVGSGKVVLTFARSSRTITITVTG